MNWQPIETAPLDGLPILVATRQYVTVARWIAGVSHGDWYETNNDPTDSWGRPLHPTHWMPLPEPPA